MKSTRKYVDCVVFRKNKRVVEVLSLDLFNSAAFYSGRSANEGFISNLLFASEVVYEFHWKTRRNKKDENCLFFIEVPFSVAKDFDEHEGFVWNTLEKYPFLFLKVVNLS